MAHQQPDKVRGGPYSKSAGDSATNNDTNIDRTVEKTRKENKGKLKEYFSKPRTRRPTREVYQPGISRLSRRPDNREDRLKKSTSGTDGFTSDDDSYRDSKESSMEKEIENIAGTLTTFYVHGSNSLPRKSTQLALQDPRKTATFSHKKPEIPWYVPRAKLVEQGTGKSDAKSDAEQPKEILSSSGSNRKVDIKPNLNKMVVTVVNDQLGVGGSGGGGHSRKHNSHLLNLQLLDKADGYQRDDDFYKSLKHRGSLDYSRESETETPVSPSARFCRYKFEGMRKSNDFPRDDDCDSVGSQSQRQSKRRSYTKTKCYTSQYRRQRTGSISSEFSAASDASMEDVNGVQTFDWDEDVECQMSKSVHEELREGTQKIQQMTEEMQNMDYLGKQPKSALIENRRVRTESSGSNYSDQLLHVRSRKRDRRRSSKHSKTESRDSSIQSNQSKDYEPGRGRDGSRKGKGRGRRRKTTYESCKNNDQENDLRKLGIKVTFGKSDRQVEVNQAANGKSAESKNSEKGSAPRGGGIIHLPHNVSTEADQQTHPCPQPDPLQHSLPTRNLQSLSREQQGCAKKKLFDPKNPQKPIIIKKSALKFQDSYDPSDYSETYPRNFPLFFSNSNIPDAAAYCGSPTSPHSDSYHSHFHHTVPKDVGLSSEDIFHQDSCYQNGQGLEVCNASRSKSHCRNMAEQLYHDSLPLEGQLCNVLSRGLQSETMNKLCQIRLDLQSKCEQIILLDLEVSMKQNVEQLLWKSVYYQLIEIYRKQLSEDPSTRALSTEVIKEQLFSVLNEGTSFYERLLEQLQTTYNFSLAPFLDTNSSPPETCHRTVKLALLTAQKIMICLGDIARYRELANDSTNYGRARSWYMRAQQLAPKNGRPYNQLAILALYTKRKLDSVYYYMRSLAASNPFTTARESLMTLFDEARKRAEASEKKRLAEREKIEKIKSQHRQHGQRREIWVSPDGTSHEDKLEDSYEEDLSKLPLDKLNRRFVQSFLNVHGKLFTKIGMETFQEMCSQMLREFHTLLQQAHPTITNVRILQLMAINMFTIENTSLKEDRTEEEDCRLLLQDYAVQLGLDMFAILVDRCAELLHSHLESENCAQEVLSYTLSHYVPAVKVWADWMICHLQLWMPQHCARNFDLSANIDVWDALAKLCNVLIQVDISHVRLYKDKRENCEPVILSEDTMLCGFVPLLSAPFNPTYVHCTVDKDRARDCLRIQCLQLFGDYLCGIETPMLSFDVETKCYSPTEPTLLIDEAELEMNIEQYVTSEDEAVMETEEDDVADGEEMKMLKAKKEELKKKVEKQSRHQQNIQMLRAKRDELQQQVNRQASRKQNIQALLRKQRNCCVEIEIQPQYLIPDTNCFIDHLTALQKLIFCENYTISVPLIVINELDGLVRGNLEGHYESIEHSDMVKENARQAMVFLEQQFDLKNPHLRAQTTKGTMLQTILYRSEATDSKGNNDDLILTCCLHYCKDSDKDAIPKSKDEPNRIYRDVVLLTDDRNLHLKAHTYNVPVKDVPSFLKWSKVT